MADAPADYASRTTPEDRWKQWSEKGTFAQLMAGSAEQESPWPMWVDSSVIVSKASKISCGLLQTAEYALTSLVANNQTLQCAKTRADTSGETGLI